jgi:hypothetical protein
MASTISLANTVVWAKGFIANLDPTLQVNTEPAITSGSLVKQTILGPPFSWRNNRVVTGFVTAAGVQDYLLGMWSLSTALSLNFLQVDTNGNSQQVTVAGTTGSAQPAWNATTGGTTTDGGVTWTNLGPISGGSSSYTFSYIETASIQDTSLSTPKWFEMSPNLCLGLDSIAGRPKEIAAQKDDNAGNFTFRLMPVPDKAYTVAITLQQRAAPFVTPSDKWAPIPDEYSYIYNWGFLALMFLYNDDPRFGGANQKFIGALLGAQQGLTETERNIFLNNWESISGQQAQNVIKMQQGNQARGV